ncbi:hypothetical protein [Opitutus terrae]|uniref:Uncharacterized protein n=1 Tax=Opitutus terrae (strain DSM 11246 / JCM 15787 / PB90-1) TaxID=452637 RepID=B1ZUF3_OPITP|nr:hypothetical protein [Opitutus terrae]ACB73996.1 conserved hypothetical protein [Opitutus terrae PB90-1]
MTPSKTGLGCVVQWVACGLALGLAQVTLGAAPSLREMLSAEEFERAGLHKLTPAELEFLSARLLPTAPVASGAAAQPASVSSPAAPASAEHAPGPERVPSSDSEAIVADTFGREKQVQAELEKKQPAARELQTRISGVFTGWTGRTVFRLDNGQVWQQVDPGVFSVNLESPVVTVRKGRFGAFYLGVEGYGSQVKVKRLQ